MKMEMQIFAEQIIRSSSNAFPPSSSIHVTDQLSVARRRLEALTRAKDTSAERREWTVVASGHVSSRCRVDAAGGSLTPLQLFSTSDRDPAISGFEL